METTSARSDAHGRWSPAGADPADFLREAEPFVSYVEQACGTPEWRGVQPAFFRMVRARVRALLAEIEALMEGAEAGQWELGTCQQAELLALKDRADELTDTLGWAADAPGELARLADEESRP